MGTHISLKTCLLRVLVSILSAQRSLRPVTSFSASLHLAFPLRSLIRFKFIGYHYRILKAPFIITMRPHRLHLLPVIGLSISDNPVELLQITFCWWMDKNQRNRNRSPSSFNSPSLWHRSTLWLKREWISITLKPF